MYQNSCFVTIANVKMQRNNVKMQKETASQKIVKQSLLLFSYLICDNNEIINVNSREFLSYSHWQSPLYCLRTF